MSRKQRKRVLVVAGTRPEAIKLAPVMEALVARPEVETRLALTGQHTDLVDQVLEVFGLEPSWDLGIMRDGQSLYDVAAGCLNELRAVYEEYDPDLVLVQGDTASDAAHLAKKVAGLRIFPDHEDRMNRSVKDVGGQVLAISQFTLAGDARKGHRPSFIAALEPHQARVLFEEFCRELFQLSLDVQTGRFRAHMQVTLCNDGPVTLLLDSKRTF